MLQEILQLTCEELTSEELTKASTADPIRDCGRAALALLQTDPDLCLQLAYQKLHDVPYRQVKTCWRRLHADSSLWKVVKITQESLGHDDSHERKASASETWIDEVVRLLDMTLILTGAPEREEVIELWFSALRSVTGGVDGTTPSLDVDSTQRPLKRAKTSHDQISITSFTSSADRLSVMPTLKCPLARVKEPSLSTFQKKLSDIEDHTPMIIEGAIQHWPALEERSWDNPEYLLKQTLGGRRLVPVEIGKSYTDEGWSQKIVTFKEFMKTYMIEARPESLRDDEAKFKPDQKGYLAQHDLFAQMPSLRADISIPDYCYCDPAPSPHLTNIKPVAKLSEPLLNAWFGPAGTTSPLHTDPYHNILAQVVGYKYVRLYAPAETEKLYPRDVNEDGVDMSNTSQVDLDDAMAVYPQIAWGETRGPSAQAEQNLGQREKDFEELFPNFKDAKYIEGVLGPGDCLYLPVGWWHYVRSLTPSFSVSFWFNWLKSRGGPSLHNHASGTIMRSAASQL
ncbi:jumonji domain-containing 5 [Pyrenochaeta sp. DS3sAY3a]|nr:jumonji domain-containing 5 [Pyrenochaeta sp. DS3sAY3a]